MSTLPRRSAPPAPLHRIAARLPRVGGLGLAALLALATGCPEDEGDDDDATGGGPSFVFNNVGPMVPLTVPTEAPPIVQLDLRFDGELPARAEIRAVIGGSASIPVARDLLLTPPERPGRPGVVDVTVTISGVNRARPDGLRYHEPWPLLDAPARPDLLALPGSDGIVAAWSRLRPNTLVDIVALEADTGEPATRVRRLVRDVGVLRYSDGGAADFLDLGGACVNDCRAAMSRDSLGRPALVAAVQPAGGDIELRTIRYADDGLVGPTVERTVAADADVAHALPISFAGDPDPEASVGALVAADGALSFAGGPVGGDLEVALAPFGLDVAGAIDGTAPARIAADPAQPVDPALDGQGPWLVALVEDGGDLVVRVGSILQPALSTSRGGPPAAIFQDLAPTRRLPAGAATEFEARALDVDGDGLSDLLFGGRAAGGAFLNLAMGRPDGGGGDGQEFGDPIELVAGQQGVNVSDLVSGPDWGAVDPAVPTVLGIPFVVPGPIDPVTRRRPMLPMLATVTADTIAGGGGGGVFALPATGRTGAGRPSTVVGRFPPTVLLSAGGGLSIAADVGLQVAAPGGSVIAAAGIAGAQGTTLVQTHALDPALDGVEPIVADGVAAQAQATLLRAAPDDAAFTATACDPAGLGGEVLDGGVQAVRDGDDGDGWALLGLADGGAASTSLRDAEGNPTCSPAPLDLSAVPGCDRGVLLGASEAASFQVACADADGEVSTAHVDGATGALVGKVSALGELAAARADWNAAADLDGWFLVDMTGDGDASLVTAFRVTGDPAAGVHVRVDGAPVPDPDPDGPLAGLSPRPVAVGSFADLPGRQLLGVITAVGGGPVERTAVLVRGDGGPVWIEPADGDGTDAPHRLWAGANPGAAALLRTLPDLNGDGLSDVVTLPVGGGGGPAVLSWPRPALAAAGNGYGDVLPGTDAGVSRAITLGLRDAARVDGDTDADWGALGGHAAPLVYFDGLGFVIGVRE